MKIIELVVENVKRVVAVDITPQGNLVVIGGKNGAGKTSILDSISYVLGGKNLLCDRPLREGEQRGKASVTLDGEPRLLVTRTFTPDGGGSLTVTSPDGTAKYSSPQKLLDALVGRLSFDPLDFARQEPRRQLETLRLLTGLDFGDLEAKRKALYDARTICGRDVAGRQGQIEAMPTYPDAPASDVCVSDLAGELQRANDTNHANEQAREHVEAMMEGVEAIAAKIVNAEKQIRMWKEQLAKCAEEKSEKLTMLEQYRAHAAACMDVDTAAIQAKIAGAEEVNKKVRANRAVANMKSRFEELHGEFDSLTRQIEALDREKARAIAAAKLPVEGLGFGEDGVTFRGLPFSQCSSAEQLRISVAMALAANPKLKVLLIRDGSLLDSDSLRMVAVMAHEADAQVWMERVGEGSECSVIIEDGSVKARGIPDADSQCPAAEDTLSLSPAAEAILVCDADSQIPQEVPAEEMA